MTTAGIVCKGSWVLGSACGRCSRCFSTAHQASEAIRTLLWRIRHETPSRSEWRMLAAKIREEELLAANGGDYDGARLFKTRASEIDQMLGPQNGERK